jgi:hypothetical protein
MGIVVERVEVLVRQALDEVRRAVDVPAVHDVLDCLPGGRLLLTMIGTPPPSPVKAEPIPVTYSQQPVPLPDPVATTSSSVPAEPPPPAKAKRRSPKPSVEMHPVPIGTRARILTGAFTGWTGPLQWSPAKGVYNVPLTGPDGQRTRTTLSPSRLGTSWEVAVQVPIRRGMKAERKEAQS